VNPVTISGSVSGLVPGGHVDVPIFAKNTNATTSVALGGVSVVGPGTPTTGVSACDTVSGATSNFTSTATYPLVVPPSGATAGTQVGTLRVDMANNSSDQDPCKNQSFSVAFTTS
jgi:hypothetical protein